MPTTVISGPHETRTTYSRATDLALTDGVDLDLGLAPSVTIRKLRPNAFGVYRGDTFLYSFVNRHEANEYRAQLLRNEP